MLLSVYFLLAFYRASVQCIFDLESKCLARRLPHGVQNSSVLHDAEQLVGSGHVVRNRTFAISEESVRCPDIADH